MYLLNQKIVHGLIWTVKDITNKIRYIPYELHIYVIIEFKETIIDKELEWRSDLPRTYIPIVLVTVRGENKCCNIISIPIRVCKALTIHNFQGMNIGPGNSFQHMTLYLPEEGEKLI